MPGNPSEIPVTTYGQHLALKGWSADTVCTGVILRAVEPTREPWVSTRTVGADPTSEVCRCDGCIPVKFSIRLCLGSDGGRHALHLFGRESKAIGQGNMPVAKDAG